MIIYFIILNIFLFSKLQGNSEYFLITNRGLSNYFSYNNKVLDLENLKLLTDWVHHFQVNHGHLYFRGVRLKPKMVVELGKEEKLHPMSNFFLLIFSHLTASVQWNSSFYYLPTFLLSFKYSFLKICSNTWGIWCQTICICCCFNSLGLLSSF